MSKYQEEEQMNIALTPKSIIYKTPIYQRNAHKAYYERNKNNVEHIEKSKASQRAYYQLHKERILENKRKNIKNSVKNVTNDKDIIDKSPICVDFN